MNAIESKLKKLSFSEKEREIKKKKEIKGTNKGELAETKIKCRLYNLCKQSQLAHSDSINAKEQLVQIFGDIADEGCVVIDYNKQKTKST